MPINTKHKDYEDYKEIWKKCRDFYEGEESVKNQGVIYLPKLSGQDINKYNAYKDRALFYNAAGRTVAALVAAVFAREASIKLPKNLEYLRENATDKGDSLGELLASLITNEMITGRTELLADRKGTSKPYLVQYDETQLINWKVSGSRQFVILAEPYEEEDPKDTYVLNPKLRYRELIYEDGMYTVRVWESADNKKFEVVNTIEPTKNGQVMDFIPFVCITPTGLDYKIDRPPILDMVNVLASHYRLSADLFNAYHTICIPTPYVTGLQVDPNKQGETQLHLGADTAIILPEPNSRVGFLEFQGQGVLSVESALTKMENMLAALGARLVETQKKSFVETAEGVRTRESAAVAVLNSVITSTEIAVNKVIKMIAAWENADPDEVNIKINRDLVQTSLDANMLIALIKSLQDGSMSFETFFHNLQEAGMYPPESTVESEQQNIEKFLTSKMKELRDTSSKDVATISDISATPNAVA